MNEQDQDWSRVDRTLEKAAGEFIKGTSEEDFQGVGLLCREALISLAQIVHEPTAEAVDPSATDSKRILEAFFGVALPGSGNEEFRRYAKAAVAVANALVHRRTATYRDAAIALEATSSTVSLASILTGRTEKERAMHTSEPFRIPEMSDPILKEVIEYYRKQGENTLLPLLESKDVHLAKGYRIAFYPGTAREVWVGFHAGRYEHLLMLRPLPA